MKPPKEELYAINIKGEQRGNQTIQDVYYMVGNDAPSYTGKPTKILRISMAITGDKLFIYFEDESRMTIGYTPLKIDLFYRPVKLKEEEPKKENNG
jgi:hypothetical protein